MTEQTTLFSPPPNQLDIKSPMFMPKPGWGGKLGNFTRKFTRSGSVFALIPLILIIIGARWYIQRQIDAVTSVDQAAIPESIKDAQPDQAAQTADTTFTIQAGQGLTHMARAAIQIHIQSNDINLSPEQRVYAEDYLRRRTGITAPHPGQAISFKAADMQDAVAKAQSLPAPAIQNLKQYANRVKSWQE